MRHYMANRKTMGTVRNHHGLTGNQIDQILEDQGGACAICSLPFGSDRRYEIDHDHKCCSGGSGSCGECVRGFLCPNCNTGIGRFNDDPRLMLRAVQYLMDHGSRA